MEMEHMELRARTLDENLKTCPTCWMCRNICPVGNTTNREIDSPRGFTLIADGVLSGRLKPTDDVIDVLSRCVDCRQCTNWCLGGFSPWQAVQAARAHIAEQDSAIAPAPIEISSNNASVHGGTALLVSDCPSEFEKAALTLLQRVRPNAVVLYGDTGYSSQVLGHVKEGHGRLVRTIEGIKESGCETLVILSPSDARTLSDLPGELGKLLEAVQIEEFVDFLHDHDAIPKIDTESLTVAYHDACSATRGTGRDDKGRSLLGSLTSLKVVELPWSKDRAQACGQGGGLPHSHAPLSGRLARARLEEAKAAGAQTLVVDAPECAEHLARYSDEVGISVISLHELIAKEITKS